MAVRELVAVKLALVAASLAAVVVAACIPGSSVAGAHPDAGLGLERHMGFVEAGHHREEDSVVAVRGGLVEGRSVVVVRRLGAEGSAVAVAVAREATRVEEGRIGRREGAQSTVAIDLVEVRMGMGAICGIADLVLLVLDGC